MDAISGATVTVIVLNQTIMRNALAVAHSLNIVKGPPKMATPLAPANVKRELFEPLAWQDLLENGGVRQLKLTRGEIDVVFQGTVAENIDQAVPTEKEETFIDLYYAYLNIPSIGRNLLGEERYKTLMSELQPGEHALLVVANGRYSFKGSGFVRGGMFDRFTVQQGENTITFRDSDYQNLEEIPNAPPFTERALYIIRDQHHFEVGQTWQIELLVRRQTGPLDSVFTSFRSDYQAPAKYLNLPPSVSPISLTLPSIAP